jgi:hypothetical protein
MANYTASKTLFSKADLYHMADKIVEMYDRMKLIYDFAVMGKDEQMQRAYSGILTELEILIEAYQLREMIKIK